MYGRYGRCDSQASKKLPVCHNNNRFCLWTFGEQTARAGNNKSAKFLFKGTRGCFTISNCFNKKLNFRESLVWVFDHLPNLLITKSVTYIQTLKTLYNILSHFVCCSSRSAVRQNTIFVHENEGCKEQQNTAKYKKNMIIVYAVPITKLYTWNVYSALLCSALYVYMFCCVFYVV